MKRYLIIFGVLLILCFLSFIIISKQEDGSIANSFLSDSAVVLFYVFKFPLFLFEKSTEAKIFTGNLFFLALYLNVAIISLLLRFILFLIIRALPKKDQSRTSHRLNHYF